MVGLKNLLDPWFRVINRLMKLELVLLKNLLIPLQRLQFRLDDEIKKRDIG